MNKQNKLVRKPLNIKKTQVESSSKRIFKWVVKVENEKEIHAKELKELKDGEKILHEIGIFISSQRKKRTYVYCLLRYLKYVASTKKVLDRESLNSYKKQLNKNPSKEANSKAQEFSICINFLKHLMSAGLILPEALPQNFKYVDKKSKQTFYEKSYLFNQQLDKTLSVYCDEIKENSKKNGIDMESATVCFYSEKCMNVIHDLAINEVQSALNDMEFIDNIISQTSSSEFKELRGIANFSEYFAINTIEGAVTMLYAHYGFKPPKVEDWIPGVYDTLKVRGWTSSQIRLELNRAKDGKGCFYPIINKLSNDEILRSKKIKDWRLKALNKKSIVACFQILYAKYGFVLPSQQEWPFGLADYLKNKGWPCTRVYSAFFPGRYIHRPLLAAFLSHQGIAPNVDSVFYYTYIDSIKTSFEKGFNRLYMDKKRGKAVEVELRKNDPLIVCLKKFISKFQNRLESFDEGLSFLRNKCVSIFGNLLRIKHHKTQEINLRLYSPETASDWIRGLLKKYSINNPILIPLVLSGVTGQNFRPTSAVILKLKGISLGKIKNTLGHSSRSTTKVYTEKVETSSLLNKKNRDFQEFILDQVTLKNLNANKSNNECIEPDLSIVKFNKRFAFKTDDAAASWVAYRDEILKEQSRLMYENPTRWGCYWVSKLAEYEVLISQLDSNTYEKAKNNARLINLPVLS